MFLSEFFWPFPITSENLCYISRSHIIRFTRARKSCLLLIPSVWRKPRRNGFSYFPSCLAVKHNNYWKKFFGRRVYGHKCLKISIMFLINIVHMHKSRLLLKIFGRHNVLNSTSYKIVWNLDRMRKERYQIHFISINNLS